MVRLAQHLEKAACPPNAAVQVRLARVAGQPSPAAPDCVKMLWALHSPAISAARAFLPLHFGRQMTRRTSFAWGKCPTVSTFHTVWRNVGPLGAPVEHLPRRSGIPLIKAVEGHHLELNKVPKVPGVLVL